MDKPVDRSADRVVAISATYDNCRRAGSIRLCTINADRYLNVLVKDASTITPTEAKALRDALNAIYPEAPVEAPKPAKKATPKGAQVYKGNGKHDWETVIEHDSEERTVRLRVPGGWLYAIQHDSGEITNSQTFVPVPEVVGYAV